jgi:hypothetical protein
VDADPEPGTELDPEPGTELDPELDPEPDTPRPWLDLAHRAELLHRRDRLRRKVARLAESETRPPDQGSASKK